MEDIATLCEGKAPAQRGLQEASLSVNVYWIDLLGLMAVGLWLFTAFQFLMLFIRYMAAWRDGQLRYTLLGVWARGMHSEVKFHRKRALGGALGFVALCLIITAL